MAKARIVYEVDNRQLDALQKQLDEIKKQNQGVEESWKDSNDELKKTGGVLNDLKGAVAGLGLAGAATAAIAEFAKLTQEIIKNRKEVALLTKETGRNLDTVTAKIKATSQVFDQDFNQVLQTANVLSQEFGITLSDAIDEVNRGFERGLDINGEYLDTLREYSTFISEAGLNTRQFNRLIQEQVRQGVFSDKGIDAIKEAVISIRELTPATRDALKAIGIDTDQLIRNIRSGATTYFEAIQEISQRTRELADPQATGQVLADVFRGAGEDAGDFVLTLDRIGNEFAELTAEQEAYAESTNRLLQSSEDFNNELTKFSTNFTGFTNILRTFLNDAGAGTLRLIDDLANGFNNLDKQTESYRQSVSTLTIQEQEEEFRKLTEQLDQVNERLDPNSTKYVFGLSPEEESLAQKELDEINAKLGVLNDLSRQRTEEEEKQAEITRQRLAAQRELARIEAARAQQLDELESIAPGLDPNIGDQSIANEIKLQEDLFAIRDDAREKEEAAKDEQLRLDREREDERRQLLFETGEAISGIFQQFTDLRIQQIDTEITALEIARNRELELAEGNAERQDEINQQFDQKARELRTRQANAQKQASLFEIAINTASAIAEALPNIPLSILAGVTGAAQAAFVLAQPIPQFAKGTLFVDGASGVDQVHAKLTRGEAVIPVRENQDYGPAIHAIYTRSIDPDIINQIAQNGGTQPNITVNDYDKLAKAVMNQPRFKVTMDESGFSHFMHRQNKSLEFKQNKFKF